MFQNHNPRSFLRNVFGGKTAYTPKPGKNYAVRANVPKSERPSEPRALRRPLTPAGIELLGHAPRGRKPRAR